MALEITNDNIDEVLNEKKITLVDFWAPWCGPCRILGPIVDKLHEENSTNENVIIGKVNVDENGDAASIYKVRNIPTILIFKDGEVVERLVGVQTKENLQSKINSLNETTGNQEN